MGRFGVSLLGLAMFPLRVLAAQQPVVIAPADTDIWHHRLGPEAAVHLTAADLAGTRFLGMEYVEFEIVVSANGRVESARPVTGKANSSNVPPHLDEAQAIELSRVFKPWLRDGVPIRVQVHDYVSLLPPEQYAAVTVPFPEIHDISAVRIGLSRTGCFGDCSSYDVTISGDGTVHYSGHASVFIQGEHTAHISPDAVRELLVLFRKADFFSAKDVYRGNWTDNPTQKISLTVGTLSKTITDYVGTDVGLPLAIRNLEDQIDEAADTRRWTAFTENTAPSLRAEHWNFAAATPANIALYSATLGNPALAEQFLTAHAPIVSPDASQASPVCSASTMGDLTLVRRMMQDHPPLPANILNQCLLGAATSGNRNTVQFWLDKGADPKVKPPSRAGDWISDLGYLPAAIFGGNPEIVQRFLDAGASLPNQVSGEPILTWAMERTRSEHREVLIPILASAGADPNGRDWMGRTPLIADNFYPELVQPLLAAGAELEARDNNGCTPLLANAFNEQMVRALLAAGADPSATAKNGDTALKAARQYACPACADLIQAALDKRSGKSSTAQN
jgi:ankyrin repeat protein